MTKEFNMTLSRIISLIIIIIGLVYLIDDTLEEILLRSWSAMINIRLNELNLAYSH